MQRADNSARPALKNRLFTIIVLTLLSALVLAAIFVPLGIYRSRGEVIVSYGVVTVRRDLYVFWLSQYKYVYLAAASRSDPSAADTPEYWAGLTESGVTRAEEARKNADEWIRRVVYASAEFEDADMTLSARTLDEMEDACRRLLQYDLNTEKKYDRAAGQIGFRYSTVRRALLYQSEGESYVSGISDADFAVFCDLAEREITIRPSAKKIDFVSLPFDARLYSASYLP